MKKYELILGDKNVVLARVELNKTFAAEASACRSKDRLVGDRADGGKVQHQPSNLRRER